MPNIELLVFRIKRRRFESILGIWDFQPRKTLLNRNSRFSETRAIRKGWSALNKSRCSCTNAMARTITTPVAAAASVPSSLSYISKKSSKFWENQYSSVSTNNRVYQSSVLKLTVSRKIRVRYSFVRSTVILYVVRYCFIRGFATVWYLLVRYCFKNGQAKKP